MYSIVYIYIYLFSSINIYIIVLLYYCWSIFVFVLYIPCASKTLWKGLWRKDIMRRIMGPLNREACLLQGFKMCTAKRHIILFAIFTKSWSETENNKIFWCKKKMHNFRPDHGPTVDKPWNDLSRAWNGLSRAWTGVWEFSTNWFHFFCYSQILDPPRKRATIWISIWILLMAQEFKNIEF